MSWGCARPLCAEQVVSIHDNTEFWYHMGQKPRRGVLRQRGYEVSYITATCVEKVDSIDGDAEIGQQAVQLLDQGLQFPDCLTHTGLVRRPPSTPSSLHPAHSSVTLSFLAHCLLCSCLTV